MFCKPSFTIAVSLFFCLTSGLPGLAGEAPSYPVEEKGTFFKTWLVCGPFANGPDADEMGFEHGPDCVGFFADLLAGMGGESAANPKEGDSFVDPETNQEFVWRRYESEGNLIPFDSMFKPNDQVVAYGFCRLEAEEETRAILSVGSNDGVRIFLNGGLVHEHHIARWLETDTDYVPIDLRKGTNRLLIKVDEGSGDWGFSARLLDYEETIESLENNLETHRKLTVITSDDDLVAHFGQSYKIETLNPGAKATIEVRDDSGELWGMLRGQPGVGFEFPERSFEDGPLHFTASFPLSETLTVSSKRGHFVGKLPRHERPEMVLPELVCEKDGKPFFPIGTYGASPEDYEFLKSVGYNFVVAGVGNLDEANEAGLLAAVGFHGDDESYLQHLEETIREHKDHPAVLCWMLADEPGYNRMDLLNMHRAYELVHRLDPVHPSYLVITDNTVYGTFGRCCDVLAIDTYPISKKAPISDVGKNIASAIRISDGDLPVWHCGQKFNWPSDRYPTPEEHRFMTYQALLDGAKGMLWYTFRWRGKDIRTHAPELWSEHAKILGELDRLEPFLLMAGSGSRLAVQDEQNVVRAKVKKLPDGSQMVLALNESREHSTRASVAVPDYDSGALEVLGEGRSVSVANGTLSDRFEPLAVHVYLLSGKSE